MTTCQPAVVSHNDEVMTLQQAIKAQLLEIKTLKDKLAYVLSYLGIDEIELERADKCAAESSDSSGQPMRAEVCERSPDKGGSDDAGRLAGFKTVARGSRHHQTNNFQQSIVAAVYIDQSPKRRRQSSLIVSELVPSTTVCDVEQFKQLCGTEFNTSPNVVSTKRLGHPHTDKTQPLLVVLQQEAEAQQLLRNAKRRLRQSSDAVVRHKIYISPNLTRAEAEAAYRVRAQRREAAKRRQSHVTQLLQNTGNNNSGGCKTAALANDITSPQQSLTASNSATNGRRT
jgi:hypothetical protein